MNFRFSFRLLFLVLLVGSLGACDKKKVETVPPVDTITEEPYQEHLDGLNGSVDDVKVPTSGKISGDLPGGDTLKIIAPAEGAVVTTPLVVKGEAQGSWYFEASFPISLLDDAGNELARVPAQAQRDWMTEAFVPFEATFPSFNPGKATSGKLVFEKDNPSGLPENAKKFEMPIRFAE